MADSIDDLIARLQQSIRDLIRDHEALNQLDREHGTLREQIKRLEQFLRQEGQEIRALRKRLDF